MPNEVEQIKQRLDIVDVVTEYIRLKQAGGNWKANCPFHAEKTPSFMVSKEKQIWHCFGCGEGGDVFSFVQKMENIEFPEALRLLAQKAGVKLERVDPRTSGQRNKILDICSLAAKYYHQVLLKTPPAQTAREYLKQRKVSEITIDEFNLGYAPDSWDATLNFLKEKGFSEQEIFLSGLTVRKEKGSGFYDRFRGRIIYPIQNIHGDTIAFGARTLKKDEKGAKYINSPQTPVYNKSLVLYNLDKAKMEIKKADFAVLVEGYMDVIASYQAGVRNVIASSGTALTPDQVNLIKRYTKNLAISFDSDLAGETASSRGIDIALSSELDVKVINLQGHKDPDELIKKDERAWALAVKKSESIMEYYFRTTFDNLDLTDVKNKKFAASRILNIISKLGNKIEQNHWLQILARKINTSEEILREILSKTGQKETKSQKDPAKAPAKGRQELLSERILAMALKYPQNIGYICDYLKPEMLFGEKNILLYKTLLLDYTKNKNETDFLSVFFENLRKNPSENNNLALWADILILLAEKEFFEFTPAQIREETVKMTQSLRKNFLTRELKLLAEKISYCEEKGDKKQLEDLLLKFREMSSQNKLIDNQF